MGYRKTYGDIPNGWHVHHLDGNRKNNHRDNLIAVTPEMHYEIHKVQWERYGGHRDFYACQFLSGWIDNPPKLTGAKRPGVGGRPRGSKTSEETKIKQSKALKGIKRKPYGGRTKKVSVNGIKYKSQQDACKELGVTWRKLMKIKDKHGMV